jgi:hypothetical protein
MPQVANQIHQANQFNFTEFDILSVAETFNVGPDGLGRFDPEDAGRYWGRSFDKRLAHHVTLVNDIASVLAQLPLAQNKKESVALTNLTRNLQEVVNAKPGLVFVAARLIKIQTWPPQDGEVWIGLSREYLLKYSAPRPMKRPLSGGSSKS